MHFVVFVVSLGMHVWALCCVCYVFVHACVVMCMPRKCMRACVRGCVRSRVCVYMIRHGSGSQTYMEFVVIYTDWTLRKLEA